MLSAHLWRRSRCTVVLTWMAARHCFGGIFIVVAKAWMRRSPEMFSCLSSLLMLQRFVQPRWTLLTVVAMRGGREGVVSLVFDSLYSSVKVSRSMVWSRGASRSLVLVLVVSCLTSLVVVG